jgi:small subunit ribosomal protein S4e
MVKRHLKRHATPNTWPIHRKTTTFVAKPRPGAHSFAKGMAIGTVFKLLGLCETTKEVKYALTNSEVFVNSRRVKDFKFLVGFMDVLSVPEKGIYYRMSLDRKGKLAMIEISSKEAELVLCQILQVRKIPGNKIQYNCHNGYNILSDKKDCKRNDVLMYDVAKKEVKERLTLDKGMPVLITGGGFAGSLGSFVAVEGNSGEILLDQTNHKTLAKYLFPIGDKLKVR